MRWGIFLVGPVAHWNGCLSVGDSLYAVVRASDPDHARSQAMGKSGMSEFVTAPVEVIGDALIDAYPRVILFGDEAL